MNTRIKYATKIVIEQKVIFLEGEKRLQRIKKCPKEEKYSLCIGFETFSSGIFLGRTI